MKMKAAVFYGGKRFAVEEVPIPRVEEDGLLIRVEAAGICGSDLHIRTEQPPFPVVLGHEVAGTVVELGSRANETMYIHGGPLKVGDRIALYPTVTCGHCANCMNYGNGAYSMCDKPFGYGDWMAYQGTGDYQREAGVPPLTGGFAEYMYIYPGTYLWKVPEDMPNERAALLDPLAVAVRTVELAQRCPGVLESCLDETRTALVVGDGAIGTLVAYYLRVLGVGHVVVAGGREARLDRCAQIAQPDLLMNYKEQTLEERQSLLWELTDGRGADVVFQCVGTGRAFQDGLHLMKRLGTLVECGNAMKPSPVTFDPYADLCAKHATLIGMTVNTPQAFHKAFTLLRERGAGLERLFTHRCGLDGLAETMEQSGQNEYMKGIVYPGKEK